MKIYELYDILHNMKPDDRMTGEIEIYHGKQDFDVKNIRLYSISSDMVIQLKKVKRPMVKIANLKKPDPPQEDEG